MAELVKFEVINDQNTIPHHIFKVIVIGEASVGKSCIMIRAIKNEYSDDYKVTVGADSGTFMSKVNGSNLQLQIWDTAGSEKFRSMIHVFFVGSEASLLVYDITRKQTFEALDYWLKKLRDNVISNVLIILVGNKKDQEDKREVTYKEGEMYAAKNDLFAFIETSAKTGEGVVEAFKKISKALYLQQRKGKKPDKQGMELIESTKTKGGCC